jgi:3-methylfumaryl-CoA hydratase
LTFADWIGRTESRVETVTAAPLAALSAALDRDDPPPRTGDPVPVLWHWLYCLPIHKQSELGADGHARLGEFLPPVALPRRMYAGGRVEVRRPLRVGDAIERVSRIEDVREKEGRSGSLVFVKVRHRISGGDGLALIEDQDIVYREADASNKPGAFPPGTAAGSRDPVVPERERPALREQQDHPVWRREVVPDEVLLFRYSALTFNGYRIHYDRRYAQAQGYPGLVVHAPLLATLLADLLRRNVREAVVSTFSFRAIRPLFDGEAVFVCGRPGPDRNTVTLWAEDAAGAPAFEATAVVEHVSL